MTERRSITLPLCLLGAGAVHALCVAAILPMLVTLPGPGSSGQGGPVIVDVEVLPASSSSAADANDLHPGEPGTIEDAPTSTSALPDAPEVVAPPAAPETAPDVAEAEPPKADPIADAAPPAEMPRQAEPDNSAPTVAERASTDTDPVTTQSTTPMAEPDPPGEAPAKEADSTESGIDKLLQDADRPVTPSVSQAPAESPSVARAEPASPEPSAATLDTPAATAKEPISQAAPNAKAPAKAGTPVVKKPATAPAKRAVSRARRPAKTQAQAPANQGDFKGLFGGVLAAPSTDAAKGATRRTTTQR